MLHEVARQEVERHSERNLYHELYAKLKERGILVRHFEKSRIREYNRITVGTREQMQALVDAVRQILEENR